MLKAGAGAVLTYGTVVRPVIPRIIADAFTEDVTMPELEAEVRFLSERYGCDIEFGIPVRLPERFGKLELKDKIAAINLVRDAFSKYPPDYLKKYKPTIILTSYGNWGVPGFTTVINGKEVVVMNMDGIAGYERLLYERLFQESILHHELAHVADIEDGKKKCTEDASICGDPIKSNNKEWTAMNPEGKEAYSQFWWGKAIRDVRQGKWPRDFARFYAQSSPDEDEAETVAMLMTMNDKGYRKPILKNFPVLQKKAEKAKEYLFRRSNGLMDDQYWKDLEAGLVGESYWDRRTN